MHALHIGQCFDRAGLAKLHVLQKYPGWNSAKSYGYASMHDLWFCGVMLEDVVAHR